MMLNVLNVGVNFLNLKHGKMSKAKIKFWDLGRSKAKGEFSIEGTQDQINNGMYKEFSKYLMSADISFDNGKIYAGMRTVGNYAFIGEDNKEAEKNG